MICNIKHIVLYNLITTDAAQAKKLGLMFGSMYANGFNFGNAGGVRKMLQKEGSARMTMTSRFFKENLLNVEDKTLKEDFLRRGAELQQKAIDKEAEILAIVNGKM